jgi:hypothetical protein
MNRDQKRKLVKKAQKDGMKKELAKTYAEIVSGTGEHTKPQSFLEGDKVTLNIEAVKARKNYERMSPKYKEFVEASEGVVFTVHIERTGSNIVSFAEEPKWLFWSGDLLRITEEETEEEKHSV